MTKIHDLENLYLFEYKNLVYPIILQIIFKTN